MSKLIDKIREIASSDISADEDDFMVNDYAGGNIDDAYNIGVDHGEVYFARRLLIIIESEE